MLRQFTHRLTRAVVPALRTTVQPRKINPAASYCTNVVSETDRKAEAEKIASASQKAADIDPDDAIELRYLKRFAIASDIWEVEDVINDMHTQDRVPLPSTVIAGLEACRRVNDHSLAIRFMESVRYKSKANPILWDYISQEIQPTLTKLSISTLEEMGYTEPELVSENPDYMWARKFQW
ncbi:cytochrome c oxidase subunit 5A, mitochondrial-like [Ylistrum balloti]|uniref:cytochrome c oxidase subunit 5A, mitochondrial-like n=1 Tax=Ylistrum balloti TaxID=509963 RepID=UPI002905DD1A|nr:cytochrome c oxidase subunit 5A, mitochondrial-like [Ylistrum balloti]